MGLQPGIVSEVMRHRALFLSASLAFITPSPAFSAEYYVAADGSDAGTGTESDPFGTLSHAAALMVAGDTCFVHEGVYRESVRPAASGTAEQPIRFRAYPDDKPLVAGTDIVTGDWQEGANGVYTIDMPGPVVQLFADGVLLHEARWPNATGNELSAMPRATTSSGTTTSIDDPTLPDVDWTGALLYLTSGEEWVTYTRTVVGWDSDLKRLTFDPAIDDIENLIPEAGDRYFLSGTLAALDAPGEWFYDEAAGALHLIAPEAVDPASLRIEVKRRERAFDLSTRAFVEVSGFSIFGASIAAVDSEGVLVDDCHVRYPDALPKPDGYTHAEPVTWVTGENNTWQNSSLVHAWGSGLVVQGSDHTVDNNLFEDVAGVAANSAGIESAQASGVTIQGNTVRSSGRFSISFYDTEASWIESNLAEGACLLTKDCGLFYTWDTDGAGTVVAFNELRNNHTALSAGIYLDDSSQDFVLHHNIISDVNDSGITIKAANDLINNTVVADAENAGFVPIQVSESLNNPGSVDLSDSEIKNNLLKQGQAATVRLLQPSVEDFAFYEAAVSVSDEWASFSVPFTSFAQPAWGVPVPLTLDAIEELLWTIATPGPYVIEIDNVAMASTDVPIDDLEDGDATNEFGGTWLGAADSTSGAAFSVSSPGFDSTFAARIEGTLAAGGWVQVQTTLGGPQDFSDSSGVNFAARVEHMMVYGDVPADTAANADCPIDSDFIPTTACAIDAGVEVPGITDGFAGDAPDIGAYETDGESWKAGTTTTPDFNYPTVEAGSGEAGGSGGTEGPEAGAGGEGGSGGTESPEAGAGGDAGESGSGGAGHSGMSAGGTAAGAGGVAASDDEPAEPDSSTGCGCRLSSHSSSPRALILLGLAGLFMRRRRSR